MLNSNRNKEIKTGAPFCLITIAGVSLIKRTLLSLQKSNITRLLIIRESPEAAIEDEIKNDQRITMDIQWLYNKKKPLVPVIKENIKEDFLLLSDDVIFDHAKLGHLLKSREFGSSLPRITMLAKEGMFLIPREFRLHGEEEIFSASSIVSSLSKQKDLEVITEKNIFLEKITDKKSVKRAEKKISMSLVNPCGGFIEKHVDRKISILLTGLFIQTPITPNQITLLSTLIGLSSLYFFFSPRKIDAVIGSCVFIVSIIVDCCDGEVARIKFQESVYGSMLDIICDNVVQIPLFFVIGYHIYIRHHAPYMLMIGFIAVTGSLLSFFILFYNMWCNEKMTSVQNRDYDIGKYIDGFINRDFAYLILVCALFDILEWFLIATAVGSNIMWMLVMYKKKWMVAHEQS